MDEPIVSCFPTRDHRFARDARSILETLSVPDPGELEERLRRWYPGCVVRRRDDLATVNGPDRWYVFREARWQMPRLREERLFAALARSRDLVTESLEAIDGAATIVTAVSGRSGATAWARDVHARFERTAVGEPAHEADDSAALVRLGGDRT